MYVVSSDLLSLSSFPSLLLPFFFVSSFFPSLPLSLSLSYFFFVPETFRIISDS